MPDEMTDDNAIVHLNSVWRHRANFLMAAKIEDSDDSPRQWEQLWARRLDADRFEICCIPFFIYDLALGDHVETHLQAERRCVFKNVVRDSGRRTIRVIFPKTPEGDATKREVVGYGLDSECLMEFYSLTLLGIDLASDDQFQSMTKFLDDREQDGLLKYEIGR